MTTHRHERRVGSIAVLSLILITVMMAFVAFAVDVGYILVTRTEMQRSADASAVASAWALIDERGSSDNPKTRAVAARYVTLNKTGNIALGLAQDDVEVGRLSDPSNFSDQLNFSDPSRFNAVQVRVQRTADQNGELPLFFARVMGKDTAAVDAQATASFYDNIRGFRIPKGPGKNTLEILPIALNEQTWMAWKDGDTVTLFPDSTNSPGNFGTVDIGNPNNSTAHIERQIIEGISAADMAYHPNGVVELGQSGDLFLNGETGISAGCKDELLDIREEARMIPIYRDVSGTGNTAIFHIVGWTCIAITDVKLPKSVTIRKSSMKSRGVIPADPGTEQVSSGIYSFPLLSR
jgi:hypothetical protein